LAADFITSSSLFSTTTSLELWPLPRRYFVYSSNSGQHRHPPSSPLYASQQSRRSSLLVLSKTCIYSWWSLPSCIRYYQPRCVHSSMTCSWVWKTQCTPRAWWFLLDFGIGSLPRRASTMSPSSFKAHPCTPTTWHLLVIVTLVQLPRHQQSQLRHR
jgi:hypothetical protein